MKCTKREPPPQTHKELLEEWKKDPEFVKEYEALKDKYKELKPSSAHPRTLGPSSSLKP